MIEKSLIEKIIKENTQEIVYCEDDICPIRKFCRLMNIRQEQYEKKFQIDICYTRFKYILIKIFNINNYSSYLINPLPCACSCKRAGMFICFLKKYLKEYNKMEIE